VRRPSEISAGDGGGGRHPRRAAVPDGRVGSLCLRGRYVPMLERLSPISGWVVGEPDLPIYPSRACQLQSQPHADIFPFLCASRSSGPS
jgi:hypothetical protein